jgi:hypothetical protein
MAQHLVAGHFFLELVLEIFLASMAVVLSKVGAVEMVVIIIMVVEQELILFLL